MRTNYKENTSLSFYLYLAFSHQKILEEMNESHTLSNISYISIYYVHEEFEGIYRYNIKLFLSSWESVLIAYGIYCSNKNLFSFLIGPSRKASISLKAIYGCIRQFQMSVTAVSLKSRPLGQNVTINPG